MASVYFMYRSTKENAPLTLRLLFRHNGIDYKIGAKTEYLIYSHQELIEKPKLSAKQYWNKYNTKTRPKDIETINKQNEVRTELNRIENHILKAFKKIQPENADNEWLQGIVDEYYKPNLNPEIPDTLIEFIDYYLKMKSNLKYGSSKTFVTIQNKLKNRKNQFGKRNILLSEVDDNFRQKFEEIFSDYKESVIIENLKKIKSICRYASEKGMNVNPEVLRWKIQSYETDSIYLNECEINKIYELKKLPEHLDNVRDWLLVSIYTGQRISDFMKFNKSMISTKKDSKGKEWQFIEIQQKKTKKPVAIPLHKTVLEILAKRNGEFPRQISEQKYNEYIKKVCQKAKINDKIEGGKMDELTDGIYRKKIDTYEKWELVSSHIGRRSFATNNYGKIPTPIIAAITAHSTESQLLTYIKKTHSEMAMSIVDYWN